MACSVIGRVIETSSMQYPVGKAICENQAIAISSPLTIACLTTRQVIRITDPKDLARCATAPQKLRSCNPQSRMYCPRLRTEVLAKKPTLIKPYGVILRSQPVQFSWMQVEGADRYRIVVEGVSSPRKMQLTNNLQTQLKLPAGTVAVVVQGMRGNTVLGSAVTTFDVLGQEVSSQLTQQLRLIDGFAASPQERMLLKLSIFASKDLINDSIVFLEQYQSLNKSPVLLRTLAELYLDVGQLDAAKKNYVSAMAQAKQQDDQAEYSKAKEGHRLVSSLLQPGANQHSSRPEVGT
jgi:hypothetical protein